VGGAQPLAQGEGALAVVDVAEAVGVDVHGDDGHLREASGAVDPEGALVGGGGAGGDQAGAVGPLESVVGGPGAVGLPGAVDVEPADALVEGEELVDGDLAGADRLEPVLHPDVVEGSLGEPGGEVDAE